MKKGLILVFIALVLSGCSAASLQKAEQNTRVTGMVPGGGIIYLPILLASTIAGGPKITEADRLDIGKQLSEKRSKIPGCIKWPGHVIGPEKFPVDYACPVDPDWDEIQAQIRFGKTQQQDDIHTTAATTKAAD